VEVATDFCGAAVVVGGEAVFARAGPANSAATKSTLVAKENVPAATSFGPVFRPLKVMVNAVFLGMVAAAVVMMMLLPENADVAVRSATEDVLAALASGAADASNQPVGKPSVTLPPAVMSLSFEVVNLSTTETLGVAMTVEEGATEKAETTVPIPPEGAPADAMGIGSQNVFVSTLMPVGLPAVATAPIFKPLRVMVKVVSAAMPATAVVIMICVPVVAVGVDDVAVMVGTDVEPAALSEGLTASKKPAG